MANRINRVGQHIGDYYLLHGLGGGGFGDVYLGEHIHTHAQAAVKVLHARLTSNDDLKEFINEARTFRLRHPHIIQLLDFGIASDDVPYLVMDYAPHGTLRDRHPKGTQVPLFTILSYVTPLASALQYAHDQHLIHRDVKPENMLLGAHNNVLLSDFGIAAVAHSSRSLNTQEGIGGTLPYMAPEQLQGKPRPASDQYAMGIIVYEWLTGSRPFKGTAVETAMQHSMMPPAPLRQQVPTLSADVEQVVLTALAKEPNQRFASIMAFARALQQASEKPDMSPRVAPLLVSLNTLPLPGAAAPIPTAEPVEVIAPVFTNGFLHPVHPPPASSLHAREMSEATSARVISPPAAPLRTSPPVPVPSPRRKRSARPFALFLMGLAVLVIVGSIGLTAISTHNVNAIATAQTIVGETATVRALPTVAAVAYNHAVASNGIMSGFDAQHTHNNPFERILSSTTISGLKIAWTSIGGGTTTQIGGGLAAGGLDSSPTVANSVVYVGSGDGKLYAFHL